jgi:hypothetical protein
MAGTATDILDGLSAAVATKGPCACATTANITLSGEQTIDGVLTAESRVLVKNQTDPAENGIYRTSTGDWTRTKDFSRNDDVVVGTMVLVAGGATMKGLYSASFSDAAFAAGTTETTFAVINLLGFVTQADIDDAVATAFGSSEPVKAAAFSVSVSVVDALVGGFKTTPTLAAGDVQVSKDGGAYANITSLPVETPAASGTLLLSLTATEMNADTVNVRFSDQTDPAEWSDLLVSIETVTL